MNKQEKEINSILLNAVKMAYRKHRLFDDSVGWEELSTILFDALCIGLGDEGYCQWMEELKEQFDMEYFREAK